MLLYKDARVDMAVLDETFGPFNWACEYNNLNGVTYCGVSIKDANGNWIEKWDAGTSDNNFEQEKGTASDAFKRACFKFGLGRELYNIPRIRINCPENYYYNGKFSMSFTVNRIAFEDDKCVDLVIVDRFGNVVYDLKNTTSKEHTSIPWKDRLKAWCGEHKGVHDDTELRAFFYYSEEQVDRGNKYGPERLWAWFKEKIENGAITIDATNPKHPMVIEKSGQELK